MLITVHVTPNAKENAVQEWLDDETVKIRLQAPAKDGKANAALVAFLAKKGGVAKSLIEIIRGRQTRMKHVRLPEVAYFKLKLEN